MSVLYLSDYMFKGKAKEYLFASLSHSTISFFAKYTTCT